MTIIVHVTGLSSGKTLLESWPRSLCDQMGNCNFCAFFLFLDQIWPVTMIIFVENRPSITSGSFWAYKPSPFKIRNASSLYRELQAEVWFVWHFFTPSSCSWPNMSGDHVVLLNGKRLESTSSPFFQPRNLPPAKMRNVFFFYRSQPAKA